VIVGGTTNKAFLIDLLSRPEVVSGEAGHHLARRVMAAGYSPPRRLDVALLATAVEAQDAHRGPAAGAAVRLGPSAGARRSGTRRGTRSTCAPTASPTGCGVARPARALPGRAGRPIVDVDAERTGRVERRLRGPRRHESFAVLACRPQALGLPDRGRRGRAPDLRRRGRAWSAPRPGDGGGDPGRGATQVEAGAVVAVVESMKLETALRAPVAGRVREVLVAANTQVEGGTKLVRLEPGTDRTAPVGRRGRPVRAGQPRRRRGPTPTSRPTR
jgi:acetyl/propionyl-CoA carboxylase alpha subunit